MLIDLAKLRSIASQATPGPWTHKGRYIGTPYHMSLVGECRDDHGNWSDLGRASSNAEFIATFNPEAITKLLDTIEAQAAENAVLKADNDRLVAAPWNAGYPRKHYADEWFIAKLDNGDRVVLTALPEEYSYDFKTADETYYKKERIAKWMQFPESQYLPPQSEEGKQ